MSEIFDLSQDQIDFLLDTMIWSFSRISSFDTCPLEWYLHYIKCWPTMESAQAQYGGLQHKIHEMYFKNEIGLFDLPQYYKDNYNDIVTAQFPNNKFVDLADSYYQTGLEYWENFDWDLDDYEILGVEKKLKYEYGGYTFIGYIDLLLKDKSDGKLVIVDHKSSKLKFKKNGDISKTDEDHYKSFKKQLYLYSHPLLKEYGEDSVKALEWNLFRCNKHHRIKWNRKEYEATMKWALDTIKHIKSEREWGVCKELTEAQLNHKYPGFFCMNLCSVRNRCPYKNEYVDQLKWEERVEAEFRY